MGAIRAAEPAGVVDAYETDALTFATLGKQPAIASARGGRSKVSAHAKCDEATGELLRFDYGSEAPYLHYGVVSADRRRRPARCRARARWRP